MAIGNSLDFDSMLKEGLSTYLRKLNCLAGAVLQRVEDDNGLVSFRSVYAIPKRVNRNSVVKSAIEDIPSDLDPAELSDYLSSLPASMVVTNVNRYTVELPGFGLLLLVKSAPGFSRPELKSLAPINSKLAEACKSCILNEQLHREIADREAAEEKFRSIFNNAVEGMFQTSMDGRFLEINPAGAKLLGFDSPDEVVGNLTDQAGELYVHAEARTRLKNKLNRVGSVSAFEFEYFRRDGSAGWLSVSARLIRDDKGKANRIEGSAIDITPRKQAVIALHEAKKQAESVSQMKSNFLSMVSHELRTPLTAILGFAKITRKKMAEILGDEKACTPKVVQGLKRIDTNTGVILAEGERLTDLINNVLDLAKLEAGRFEWDMVDVSMNIVLSHCLAATEVLFKDAGVAIEHDIDEQLPAVIGDHGRLIQVVLNMLSNAAKFTGEGRVLLSAAVENSEVVVRVSDTGCGVPADETDVIFDKFRQLGNTLTDKPKGTGLGLPICKEIIEYHGGKIWVEPRDGGGSVFAFTVPIKSTEELV